MITPQDSVPKLAQALEMASLYFKREDLHPYGSHKGRSIPVMIDTHLKEGASHFAISSSGNAALASAFYVEELNTKRDEKIQLDILVGQHISTAKLRKLEQFNDEYIRVTSHDRPLQRLFAMTKDSDIKPLRQSNDDTSLVGYKTLGEELLKIKDLQAVFIGTSSGTTAQALGHYFESKGKEVEIHIVQTSSCHYMVDDLVSGLPVDEQSIADAIVDQTALRKDAVTKLVEGSNGGGWIASNEQIKAAQEMSSKYADVEISTNSALSLAGLMQAVYTGKTWDGSVACLICGD